jgi:hypothetical protein
MRSVSFPRAGRPGRARLAASGPFSAVEQAREMRQPFRRSEWSAPTGGLKCQRSADASRRAGATSAVSQRGPAHIASRRCGTLASPQVSNLTISNIPGPRVAMYLLACEAQSASPVVPLTPGHRTSIGMTTVQERACFGVYAEAGLSADADRLLRGIDEASPAARAWRKARGCCCLLGVARASGVPHVAPSPRHITESGRTCRRGARKGFALRD